MTFADLGAAEAIFLDANPFVYRGPIELLPAC
jgi:hypothetical protein